MSSLGVADGGKGLIALADVPDGGFAEIEVEVDGDFESLVLYRDGLQVRGWLNICPHAGRRLDWSPGQFLKSKAGHLVCAAHGASFDVGTGECIEGPCRGESLRAVALRVGDDGAVRLC